MQDLGEDWQIGKAVRQLMIGTGHDLSKYSPSAMKGALTIKYPSAYVAYESRI
jgi:hypothetical protein